MEQEIKFQNEGVRHFTVTNSPDENLRLDCLKLASEQTSSSVVDLAKSYFKFIKQGE